VKEVNAGRIDGARVDVNKFLAAVLKISNHHRRGLLIAR
jgi:hypothetical protein